MLVIQLKEGQNVYFTSDTHYNHKNICRGVSSWSGLDKTRDFKSMDEMNDTIVNNINATVRPDDYLIHLGDWSFGGFENIEKFRSRILCNNVILVLGNHDHHIENNRENVRSLFSFVGNLITLEIRSTAGIKQVFELSHYPICSWKDMNRGVIHLFGHVHLPPSQNIMRGKSMDVGMDGNNLTPWSLQQIVSIMINQPIDTNVIPEDHHKEEVR